jgi:hypothetical protein
MQHSFKFALQQQVQISCSGEAGEVIGRAEYATNPLTSYLVRYRCADGRAVEQWWSEDALSAGDEDLVRCRKPYQRRSSTCPDCTSRPSSPASATTDASL